MEQNKRHLYVQITVTAKKVPKIFGTDTSIEKSRHIAILVKNKRRSGVLKT